MHLDEKMHPILWYIDIIDGIGTDSDSEPQWLLNLCQDVLEKLIKEIEEDKCVLYK